MKGIRRASVLGLGLIGGSVARELAARGVEVSGFDADATQLAAAVDDGAVAIPLDSTLDGLRDAELVVLAVPVSGAVTLLGRIAPLVESARLVTDVGSTKGRIVAAASALGLGKRFVGSHPMAGDHRSGWAVSRRGLFAGARVYLCPPAEADPEAINLAAGLWRGFGAKPALMRADDHDAKLAWTSHLPHFVSTALALALANGGFDRGELGPGGLDATRLAGSSPDMWTAIARENAAPIAEALAAAERELAALRAALFDDSDEGVRERLVVAQRWADREQIITGA
jgi:prephenate dehydrogenase